ncbi:MAG: OmpA family protein [Caulobacterales bacterium]|nr:OmpA family protein [Caulobacterales bacterium]
MNRVWLAAGLALLVAAPVAAQEAVYLKGGVGYGMPTDVTVDELSGFPDATLDGEGDARFMVGVGYMLENNWRFDVDAVDRYSDLGAVNDAVGTSDWQNVAVMLNAIYDLNRDGTVSPYLGAGFGVSHNQLSIEAGGVDESFADVNLGVQALAGLGVALSERVTADLEYRYFRSGEAENDAGLNFQSLDTHDVLVGLRLAFGRSAAPAAAAAAPPPPAPPTERAAPAPAVVTCNDVDFIVYFEWDRADLTTEARDVIADAADRAGDCDIARVVVTGHTDRSGSAAYNEGLSDRRARIVREELIRLGVLASQITLNAAGETSPAVQTPDGAREPDNRRTEVVIQVDVSS